MLHCIWTREQFCLLLAYFHVGEKCGFSEREIGRAKSRDQTGPKIGARLQTPVFFGARASADVPNVDPILDVNSHLLFLPYKLSFS